jgi:hypothetical protein
VPDFYYEKWRVGHKNPLNVYGAPTTEWPEGRPVCQCHNSNDALRIVTVANAQVAFNTVITKLRAAEEDEDDA